MSNLVWWILGFAGIYFFSAGLILNVTDGNRFIGKIFFKVIPALAGLFMMIISIIQLGWV